VVGWRQAPWPVIFIVCTLLFAAVSSVWDAVSGGDSTALVLSAPLWGAGMTWWFVRQRDAERAAAGVDAARHLRTQRAVLRGEAPPDRASWPAARVLIERYRAELRRYRVTPLLFAGLVVLLVSTASIGGYRTNYVTAAVLAIVAGCSAVTAGRSRRRLDAAEHALDEAETGSF
jgi:hypothetical protein